MAQTGGLVQATARGLGGQALHSPQLQAPWGAARVDLRTSQTHRVEAGTISQEPALEKGTGVSHQQLGDGRPAQPRGWHGPPSTSAAGNTQTEHVCSTAAPSSSSKSQDSGTWWQMSKATEILSAKVPTHKIITIPLTGREAPNFHITKIHATGFAVNSTELIKCSQPTFRIHRRPRLPDHMWLCNNRQLC